MPELAEVEYFRKQWNKGLKQKVLAVELHDKKKLFRGIDIGEFTRTLRGSTLTGSETHGKQMLFRFSKGGWLGIHLGMTGKLRIEAASAPALKHDHLVLRQKTHALVFSDPRQFGRVLFHHGKTGAVWWLNRPASILSVQFTLARMTQFLQRHARAPVKAVILMQGGFPGIGNWMADEILWQAKIHPARLAGKLTSGELKKLFVKMKFVCRVAMKIVGETDGDLPKSWLFNHRWSSGRVCPTDGSSLKRAQIGGRTTCWCPVCQKS